jgi:hypothetical protein
LPAVLAPRKPASTGYATGAMPSSATSSPLPAEGSLPRGVGEKRGHVDRISPTEAPTSTKQRTRGRRSARGRAT